MHKVRLLCRAVSLLFVCLLCGSCSAGAESPSSFVDPSLMSYSQLLDYVAQEQPLRLNLGTVSRKYTPARLYKLKQSMPEGGRLVFRMQWCGTTISDRDEVIDLNHSRQRVTAQNLEQLICLVPGVRKIICSAHRNLSNKVMIPLVDKYPDIEFVWLVSLGGKYTLPSDCTAFSTMKHIGRGASLTSRDLEPLQYCPHLKALDLGHHRIDDLSFLKYLPELRILILVQNKISDITPLAGLPHLQYVELFVNEITDITPLAGHRELLDLNLSGNRITDLSPLDSCGSLERLWASRNPLGEETKSAFRASHPGCTANFTSAHATADGWRKHWRYTQYIRMFKSHTWTSFCPPDGA